MPMRPTATRAGAGASLVLDEIVRDGARPCSPCEPGAVGHRGCATPYPERFPVKEAYDDKEAYEDGEG